MGIFEELGLGWQDILFHAINLVILITGLYFLLYKPVRKLIAEHREKLNAVVDENRRLNAEASELKHNCDKQVAEMKDELIKSAEVTAENARIKAEETLAAARLQAKTIVDNAKKEAVAENRRMKEEYREKVSELAVAMAERVLEREVDKSDNKKLLDECLKEWE